MADDAIPIVDNPEAGPAETATRFAGANWYRADLHVHTPFDSTRSYGEDIRAALQADANGDPTKLRDIAGRFLEAVRLGVSGAGIHVVGVTDHNSIDGFRFLKPHIDALRGADPLPVFLPGVEFTAGGERVIHFLVLFDADAPLDEIERLIGYVFGAKEPHDPDTGTPRSCEVTAADFARKVHEYCFPASGERSIPFVVIPAHLDSDAGAGKETGGFAPQGTGIWAEMKGHVRQRAIVRVDWNGFETNLPFARLPEALRELLLEWRCASLETRWE